MTLKLDLRSHMLREIPRVTQDGARRKRTLHLSVENIIIVVGPLRTRRLTDDSEDRNRDGCEFRMLKFIDELAHESLTDSTIVR